MDNFQIDITGEGDESLAKALEIAFIHNAPGGKATHYAVKRFKTQTDYYSHPSSKFLPPNLPKIENTHVSHYKRIVEAPDGHLTLVLCWSNNKDAVPLPFPLTLPDAINFVKGWLNNAGEPGPEPDHDGDNDKGWRVFTEGWGHFAGCGYTIVAVQSVWAMYGK